MTTKRKPMEPYLEVMVREWRGPRKRIDLSRNDRDRCEYLAKMGLVMETTERVGGQPSFDLTKKGEELRLALCGGKIPVVRPPSGPPKQSRIMAAAALRWQRKLERHHRRASSSPIRKTNSELATRAARELEGLDGPWGKPAAVYLHKMAAKLARKAS